MKCIDCPHFKIDYEPIKADKGYWDFGRAVCVKHSSHNPPTLFLYARLVSCHGLEE